MVGRLTLKRFVIILFVILVILACNAPAGINIGGSDSGTEQTRMAVGIQSTMLAMQLTKSAAGGGEQPPIPPIEQQQPETAIPPTYTPYPTYTLPQVEQSTLQPPPIEETVPSTQDMQERIRNAKILVYDDSFGSYDSFGRLVDSRIDDAIDGMSFSGGNVVKVHDAMGNFMSELNSGTKWDLIIVGAESRNFIRGEFWDIIGDQIRNNVAVVSEVWYLDQIANGRIAPVLSGCGIAYEKNWLRNPAAGINLNDYLVYLLKTDSPFFTSPNTIGMLIPTSNYAWLGDVGDRVKIEDSGKAILLAGSLPNESSRYGLITSCYEGRVIFQTFSSHDYKRNDMIELWQNYIINSLTNHFLVTP